MDNSNNQNQFRFLTAAVLSMIVLFGWSYFYAPTPPANNANIAATNTAPAQPVTSATTAPQPDAQTIGGQFTSQPDTTPNRSITIKSPLYEVTLDSKGAVATSWIILKNKSYKGEYPIYADGSTETDKKPLQLISQKALDQNPRELPFRLATADPNLAAIANERNYQISAAADLITLGDGQESKIDFSLIGENGIEIRKSFVFRADSYVADLLVDMRQNGQPVPNTKLAIGASI